MTDKENDDLKSEDAVQTKAEQAIEQLGPDVVQCIRKVPKRPRGRPKGSAIDDSAQLLEMAVLLESGKANSEREASRMIAQEDPGHSVDATSNRLRRKYAKERHELQQRAREVLRKRQESEDRRVLQECTSVAAPHSTGGSGASGWGISTGSSMISHLTEPIRPIAELPKPACLEAMRLPCLETMRLPSEELSPINNILRSTIGTELYMNSSWSSQIARPSVLDCDAWNRIGRITRIGLPSWKL